MPTIKTKKEMNLPELIEWCWRNIEQIERKEFKSNVRDSFGNYSTVQFSVDGYGFKTDGVSHKDTFTVEIEEEITGDTVIPRILKIGVGSLSGYSAVEENVSVNRIINKKNKYIYIIDDDYAITPFYRDGKLVE